MKRKRSAKPEPDFIFVLPDQAVAFDPVEWQFVFTYAVEVSHAPATVLNKPTDYKIRIRDKKKSNTYVFNDIPMNRLAIAMSQRFTNEKIKYYSFMWRWFAFVDLINSNVLGEDLRRRAKSEDEPDEVHPSVIELTGRFPINKEGKFDHVAFMEELRQMVADSDSPG